MTAISQPGSDLTPPAVTQLVLEPNPDLSVRVVRVVDYQTSPQQPDRCSEHVIIRTLTSAGYASGRIREELSAAVERGDLDTDGERYWLPAE